MSKAIWQFKLQQTFGPNVTIREYTENHIGDENLETTIKKRMGNWRSETLEVQKEKLKCTRVKLLSADKLCIIGEVNERVIK